MTNFFGVLNRMRTRGVLRLVQAGVVLVLVFLPLPAKTQTCRKEGDVEEDAVCIFIISPGEDCTVNVTEGLCTGEIRLELQNTRNSCMVWTGKADNSARRHVTFGKSSERNLSFRVQELPHQKYSISCRYDTPSNVEGSITFLIFIGESEVCLHED